MELSSILLLSIGGGVLLITLIVIIANYFTVSQGYIYVIESFGKYKRLATPGLNFKKPIVENIRRKISTQNTSSDLSFQAITEDQANVHFKAMILYTVKDSDEETIKKVAYKFASPEDFVRALTRTIESSIRALVATKKQAGILGMRSEIVTHVKEHVDTPLEEWGYHLLDLQINDITFDEEIIASMSRVVVALNNKTAAENEGEALKIKKTKEAEAEKAAMMINAEGVSGSREILSKSVKDLDEKVIQMLLMDKYCETLRNVAENGAGKIIFMDTSGDSMHKLISNMEPGQVKEKKA